MDVDVDVDVKDCERREGRFWEAWLETISEPLSSCQLFMVAFMVVYRLVWWEGRGQGDVLPVINGEEGEIGIGFGEELVWGEEGVGVLLVGAGSFCLLFYACVSGCTPVDYVE